MGNDEDRWAELPTLYQQQIHRSKYSRWREEDGRRETWPETVDRYLDQMERQAGRHGTTLEDVRGELRRAIMAAPHEEGGTLGSMRAVMTAGRALERDNVAGYNCFTGETEYLTRDGVRRLGDTAGTVQHVLNRDGEWAPAEIKSFGRQPLVRVTLRPGGRSRTALRHIVVATPDHRWITENRGEVTDLREGDLVKFVGARHGEDRESWIRGFGFGDGTIDGEGRARVRLCGAKARHLHRFVEFGHCNVYENQPSYDGDPLVVFHKGYFTDWKALPAELDADALGSWVDGYYAADGRVSSRQPGIDSQSADAAGFVKAAAPFAGWMVSGHAVSSVLETNFGARGAPLQRITMRREGAFRVVSVAHLETEDEVFCAVEPRTGSFTLANGVLTGNCAYLAVSRPQAFDEALYILACGTGVGFSVERRYVGQLPEVPRLYESDTTIVVRDSKIGWASALRQLVHLLYSGVVPKWDTSRVRHAGARLKTFGGRASGPEPLEDLFRYVVDAFKGAQGRRLHTIECHGVMCKVGAVIVSGGVRRSALISLSDADDDRMRDAKSGQWWVEHPEYRLANNSAVWEERPPIARFMDEWAALIRSGSGERGIVNRAGMRKIAAANGRRDPDHEFGTNPCSEIILRDRQFCNLSEVVARHTDTLSDLERKVRLATVLGTLQSTFTDFRYLSAQWRRNCEEERLLGVSITGIMDHPVLSDFGAEAEGQLEAVQEYLKAVAVDTNQEWAARLGISPSAAITCVKPSGTVSQLVDAASGIHPRWSRHYVRTNRGSKLDPVSNFMWAQGVPAEDDVMDDHNWVFSFPIEAPETAVLRDQVSAIDQLELWLKYAEHWCEHKPSITVYVREEEWLGVGAFVYRHFDRMSGVSFLPFSEHTYEQAPYQEVDAGTHSRLVSEMPGRLAWENLPLYETEDSTTGSQELACVAGNCDVP